jgi:RNA polymerase sigma factor (sigma-70 family)
MAGEYAVKISIRNGLILRRMKELGIKTQTELAKLSGLNPTILGTLIGLKKRPVNHKTGEWLDSAFALSSALQAEPEELWTEAQSNMALRNNTREINMDEEQVKQIATDGGVERLVLQNERVKALTKGLNTLSPREEYVIRRRFFDDDDLGAVAEGIGASPERVRQIEAKALRKLSHPSRGLKNYIDVAPRDNEKRPVEGDGITWRPNRLIKDWYVQKEKTND